MDLRLEAEGEEMDIIVELLEDAGRGAVPIAVRPGEPLALVLREAPSVSITGQVLEPDGTPSPKAYVRFTDARDEWIADPLRADEDGRFSARVPREACAGALVVSAQSAVGEEPTYSPFGGRKYVPNFAFGRVAVDVPPEGAVDVTVRCTPSIDVTGTVHGPDGEPVRSAQALLVRDGDVSRRRLPSGEWARTRLFLGQFHFRGVDSGTFRVHVRSEELGLLVSEPFEASGEPLALRYGGRSVARVVATVVGVESPAHAPLELGVLSEQSPAGEQDLSLDVERRLRELFAGCRGHEPIRRRGEEAHAEPRLHRAQSAPHGRARYTERFARCAPRAWSTRMRRIAIAATPRNSPREDQLLRCGDSRTNASCTSAVGCSVCRALSRRNTLRAIRLSSS